MAGGLQAFSELGCAVGDFGPSNTDAEVLAYLQANARLYVAGRNEHRELQYLGGAVHRSFMYYDGIALPPTIPNDAMLKQDVLSWIAMADLPMFTQFQGFMAARHDQLRRALWRDTEDLLDGMGRAMSKHAADYHRSDLVIQAAMGALSRMGLQALNSLEAGRHTARALVYMNEASATHAAVANIYQDPLHSTGITDEFRRTVAHEGFHAGFADLQAGFTFGLIDNRSMDLLEELGSEHQARATKYGWFHELDPAEFGTVGSYQDELTLFAALAKYASRPISASLLAEAQASPRDHTHTSSPRYELHRLLQANTFEILPECGDEGFYAIAAQYHESPRHARASFIRELARQALQNIGMGILEDKEYEVAGPLYKAEVARLVSWMAS